MQIYSWVEKGNKNWFAVKGDTDPLFEIVVEFEMVLEDQAQSENWFAFWVLPHHAELIRERYDVFFKKPKTDIPKLMAQEGIIAREVTQGVIEKMEKDWGKVEKIDIDLDHVIVDSEKELANMYSEKGLKFNTPLTKPRANTPIPLINSIPVGDQGQLNSSAAFAITDFRLGPLEGQDPFGRVAWSFEQEFDPTPVDLSKKLKDKFKK